MQKPWLLNAEADSPLANGPGKRWSLNAESDPEFAPSAGNQPLAAPPANQWSLSDLRSGSQELNPQGDPMVPIRSGRKVAPIGSIGSKQSHVAPIGSIGKPAGKLMGNSRW